MGEIVVSIGLENYVDRSNAASGLRTEPVRRTEAEGIVDTGAVMLVLPTERRRGARIGAAANGGRDLRRRAQGGTAGGRSRRHRGLRSDDGHGMRCRAPVERAPDRPDRARSAGPDRRLRQPDAHAADTGLPVAQAQDGLHAGTLDLTEPRRPYQSASAVGAASTARRARYGVSRCGPTYDDDPSHTGQRQDFTTYSILRSSSLTPIRAE